MCVLVKAEIWLPNGIVESGIILCLMKKYTHDDFFLENDMPAFLE